MFELRDIIPHVSVSDIIQKNKRREGRQQLKRARREPFKTFLIEVNCDSCEDGKIYNNELKFISLNPIIPDPTSLDSILLF